MATNARRKITVTYSNDVEGEQELDAANNVDSPGAVQLVELTTPTLVDDEWVDTNIEVAIPANATAVTITKPTDNETVILLKGTGGDSGVRLHPTDPDSISLYAAAESFFLALTADETVDDITVRLFWS